VNLIVIESCYVRILAKVEILPNRKNLLENPPDTLIIDVTEQPIERPESKTILFW